MTDASDSRGPTIFAVATQPERRACETSDAGASERRRMLFVQTGVGVQNADELEQSIIRHHATGLISIGTAGGLAPNLAAGVIVIPERIQRADGQVFRTHASWRNRLLAALEGKLRIATGDLLEVSRVIRYPNEKKALHARTRALGADMESARLAVIAERAGIPFLAIRVITDTAEDEIPKAAMASLTSAGNLDLTKLVAYLVRHPSDLPGLIMIWRRFRAATGILGQACRLAGEQPLITDN